LEAAREVAGRSAGGEEGVGIVAGWQLDDMGKHSSMLKTLCQHMCGLLARAVYIRIECDEHPAVWAIG